MSIQEQVQETCEACGCVAEIGTIISEGDNSAVFSFTAENEAAAQARFDKFSALAKSILADVSLTHEFVSADSGVSCNCSFGFSCTAEKLIFEMRARAI
jgi:uncharacterized protein (TIGR00743 family)